MSNHNYSILSQPSEDALHPTRLLGIEERPFQRVTKRLLDRDSLLRQIPKQLPSPPPEGEGETEDPSSTQAEDAAATRQKFREEVLLDFAALESSITRIQLIQTSNARERERYAAEKAKILATAQAVRENTVLLREQLGEAQKVLELRKGYDALAAKILEDKKLKSRDECRGDIAGLEKEIEELEQGGGEIEGLWVGRREQFERIVVEGEAMRRVIKGIKEPEEGQGEEDETMEEGEGEKDDRSRMGTPGLDDGRTPRHELGGRTPMPEGSTPLPGGATPMHEGMEEDGEERPGNKFLEVEGGTQRSSRAASPGTPSVDSTADVEMGDGDDAQSQTKTTAGLEAKDEQVKEPTEGMTMEMDES
ncbi:hypothetical protein MBLNU13_g05434t1 [Cladosporium sp. NU13]